MLAEAMRGRYLGLPYAAASMLKKAAKLDKHNPHYWLAVGNAEYSVGNVVSSIEAYEAATAIDPCFQEAWENWSLIHYENGELEEAMSLISSGIEEMPDNADLYYRATAYLISSGKYKEGLNYLENGLLLDFDRHVLLYEFFPKLETQKALFNIIEQFKNKDQKDKDV